MDGLIFLVGAFLALRFIGQGVPRSAELFVQNVRFIKGQLGLAGWEFTLKVNVANYSRTEIPLDRGNGKVFYGNDPVANFLLARPVRLKPGEFTDIDLVGSIPTLGFSSTLIEAIKSGNFAKPVKVKGELIYGLVVIPFEQTINI